MNDGAESDEDEGKVSAGPQERKMLTLLARVITRARVMGPPVKERERVRKKWRPRGYLQELPLRREPWIHLEATRKSYHSDESRGFVYERGSARNKDLNTTRTSEHSGESDGSTCKKNDE